ncbi:Tyrosine--tRNA ligase [compost metagenome]
MFQQRALPEDIEEKEVPAAELENGKIRLIKLLTLIEFAASNGEAKRSIQQGAVKLNEEKISDPNAEVELAGGEIIQVGKRKFAKLLVK